MKRSLMIAALLCTALNACTMRGFYEGQRQSARNDCERIQSEPDRVRCLAKHDDDYDTYQRKREALEADQPAKP